MDCESDKASSEVGSGCGTPRSQDQETLRCDTPGTMPTFQYSKEQLYTLEKMPASLIIPDCLEKEYIVDGVWDPERWVRSFGGPPEDSKVGSCGSSSLTSMDLRDKRTEIFRRNSGCEHSLDPRERLKEDKDAIVLSPQRRSFGTGCHVSQQPLLQRALSNIKADRGRRDGQRRIGSGRIQIDHNRETEFRNERLERDRVFRSESGQDRGSEKDQDIWNERPAEKESREFRNAHESVHDRDYHKPRDGRDRFEREDREKRFEQNRVFNSSRKSDDRHRDSREFQSFNNRHNHHRDHYNSREVEPEWFIAGPSSKSDTIELHGFDQEREQHANDGMHDGHHVAEDVHVPQNTDGDMEVHCDEHNVHTEVKVADRNGSLETHESSLSETSQPDMDIHTTKTHNQLEMDLHTTKTQNQPDMDLHTMKTQNQPDMDLHTIKSHNQPDMDLHTTRAPPTSAPSFDFNEFFNIDNIPGLLPVQDESLTESDLTNIGGSRFYQLYKMDQGACGSKGNSRRSSLIEDEFSYLNDMLNGSRSPLNHSPAPASANFIKDCSTFLAPFASSDKQHHLEFGTVSQKFGTTANHNALVTALLNNAAVFERNRSSPTSLKNSPQDAETKLKAILFGKLDSPSNSGNTTPSFSSPLNVSGKIKTVTELENELQRNVMKPILRSSTPLNGQLQQLQDQASPHEDLTAFNKLISLMQAGAAKPIESPKTPLSTNSTIFSEMQRIDIDMVDGYLVNQSTSKSLPSPQYSNLNDSSAAQKQFLEALQRNKEQQLQIRQATMQRHQGHISNNMAQLNNQQTSQVQQMVTMPQQNNQQTTQLQHNMQQQTASHFQQMATLQQQNSQQTLQFQQLIDNLINQGMQGQRLSVQGQRSSMQGQRSSTDTVVTSFLKANPTIITKPASPPTTPLQPMRPIVTYVAPVSSPRGPSPFPVLQSSALLSRQTQVSPRVPSPIMFSQQPPRHLNAPSPIHPINGSQTPVGHTGSSTNTIRPPYVPRVPSPQELVMHTQAILQNALIKKQLEDQKERFFKKQQERVKSPSAFMGSTCVNISNSGYVTSLSSAPATSISVSNKTAINVAFTPTSLIKTMHTKKASEKERSRQNKVNNEAHDKEDQILNDSAEKYPGTDIKRFDSDQSSNLSMHMLSPSVQYDLPSQHHHQTAAIIRTTSLPPPSMIHTMPPPPLLNQMDAATSQQIRAFICQQTSSSFGSHLPLSTLSSVSSSLPVSGRPIVKGNPYALPQTMATPTMGYKELLTERPIIGGNSAVPAMDMVKLLQQQQMRNAPQIPMSQLAPQSTPYGISLTGVGKLPVQSTTLGFGPQAPTPISSQVLIQQMMQESNQRTFAPLATVHTQQQMIDPRSAHVPFQQAPRTLPQQLNSQTFNLQMNTMINGPNTQGHIPVAMVTVSSSNKGDNLMKWFSTDILKTSLPTMPPLPVQGQHVLTLDEIERS